MDKSALSLDNFEALGRHLKVIKECPMCGTEYTVESRQVVVQEEAMHIVHVQCQQCQHALLLFISNTQNGVGILGSMTDLSAADISRLQARVPWTDNDLLEAADIVQKKSHLLINIIC